MKRGTRSKTKVSVAARSASPAPPIQLFVDLSVDPGRETEMLNNFHTVFRPAAARFRGFIDVRMLKLRTAVMESTPKGVNYRFELMYESEELRQRWATSRTHDKVWPMIENTLATKNYDVLIFDEV